jgi:hypothetical protein
MWDKADAVKKWRVLKIAAQSALRLLINNKQQIKTNGALLASHSSSSPHIAIMGVKVHLAASKVSFATLRPRIAAVVTHGWSRLLLLLLKRKSFFLDGCLRHMPSVLGHMYSHV